MSKQHIRIPKGLLPLKVVRAELIRKYGQIRDKQAKGTNYWHFVVLK